MGAPIDMSSGLLRRHVIRWQPIGMGQFKCPDLFGEQSRIVLVDHGIIDPKEEIASLRYSERCFCGKNGFWLWLNKVLTSWKATVIIPKCDVEGPISFYFGYCSYPGGVPVPMICPDPRTIADGPFAVASMGCPVTFFAISDGAMDLRAKSDASEEGRRIISERLIDCY